MIRASLVFALSAGVSTLASADVYKCMGVSGISYQSAPCASGDRQAVIATRPAPAETVAPALASTVLSRASVDVAATATATLRSERWQDAVFRRTSVAVGMSDDEVLNLPGWGLPTRIERSRAARAWHEQWTYALADGSMRRLHFVNARLADMDIDPPAPAQIVSLTPR